MWEMRRACLTVAAAALALAASAGSAAAVTTPSAAGGAELTGRALIGVSTPDLPIGRGAAVAEERSRVLARSRELLRRVARREGISVDGRSVPGGLIATELDGSTVAELRRRLADDPLVESVEPEGRAELRYTPTDPALLLPDPHAPNGDFAQWNVLDYGSQRAWDFAKGFGGEVAVIDSGAYTAHPDLAARVSGSLDCSGLFGCTGTNVTDEDGHGTHVSGLACAASDNGYGLASIGFACSIYVIKAGSGGMLSFTSIINSIYAAVWHGADAINMSFGGGSPSQNLKSAVDFAWANGVVPVAAGANEPTPSPSANYPAQYIQPEGSGPNIDAGEGLVVTSANYFGARSAWAQRTSGVSVAAFGSATDATSGGQQGILSTWPPPPVALDTFGVRTSLFGDNRFAYLVGTSMANPQVAGLVALMRSANPVLPAAKLIRLIKLTAGNCGQYKDGLAWGVIRADRAVAAAINKDVDPPGSEITGAKRIRRLARTGAVSARKRPRGNVSVQLKKSDGACSKELPIAGVRKTIIFASAKGGTYRRVAKTKKDKATFFLKPGRRYRLYSIAVDGAGNREAVPTTPDAKVRPKRRSAR
jgi:serine protease